MPRDDLSIDFVKKMAPSTEAQDPAAILEDFIHRTANLPEEIRFIQDEIADKDRTYQECVKTIEESDAKIQRWIRMNGSHTPFPREQTLRETIRENYTRADKLAEEKIQLAQKAQTLFDKHIRHLDLQIKQLSDRNEPGFTDPDEIPSVVRPSAANNSNTSLRVLAVSTASNTPLNPITNNATPTGSRAANPQIRTTQSQAHISSSAPTSPAASMIMSNRNQRESSAGPGSGAPKRGPRVSSSLGGLPTASSGLARHSSLGPGTPKAGTPGASRAGSAGPRASSKAGSVGIGRKGTPSAGVSRKKPPNSKSTLSRVKRAGMSKGSPVSTADSELSDAESVRSSRAGSRAGSGTPVPRPHNNSSNSSHHHQHQHHHHRKHSQLDGDEEMRDRGGSASAGSGGSDDEDEEGKKYCLCQHVSYGDMVACDNPACPYEWFHWTCVGLKSEPEGRWYCPSCTESMKKKGK